MDENEGLGRAWTLLVFAAVAVAAVLVAVDLGIKSQVIEESRKLREVIARERAGSGDGAAQADRGVAGAGGVDVVPVDDGPPASPAATENGHGSPGGTGHRERRPPS